MNRFRTSAALCGTAMAALMISGVSAAAETTGMESMPGRFMVTVDMGEMDDATIALPIGVAARLCEDLAANEIARDVNDGVQDESCTISEEDARGVEFQGGRDDDEEDDGGEEDDGEDDNAGHGNDEDRDDGDNPGQGQARGRNRQNDEGGSD